MLVGQYDDCLEALVNKTKLKPKLNQTALDIWRLVGSREPQGVITRSHKDQINTVNIYHFLFPFPFCHKNPPDIPVKGFLHPAALIIFYIVQSTENLRGWNKSPFYEDKAFSSPSSLKAHRATV